MIGKTNSSFNEEYNYITITVPDEFQIVEYIESDGSSYIDTELMAHSNMSCEMTFSFNELPKDGCLVGCRYDRSTNSRLYFYHYFNGNKLGYGNYFGDGNITINTVYTAKVKLQIGEQSLILNENKIFEENINTYINPHSTFYIFGMNIGNIEDTLNVKAKMFSCKIWDDNIITRYFLPVYNKITEEIGLFDLVNQKFHKNMGKGYFLKGNDSSLPLIDITCNF